MAELCLLLQHNTWGHTTAPTVARSARRAVWHHVAGHTAATHCCPPLPSAAHFYAHAMPQLYSSMRSWAVTPFSFAAKMPASPSNCREPWLPRPRQRVRPELRHVVVLRHQTLNTTLLICSLFFYPFPSGYCCRGRTKSLESSQRGLGGHFRVVICPPAPLLAGTISACLAAASSPPASLGRTTSEASL